VVFGRGEGEKYFDQDKTSTSLTKPTDSEGFLE
jgi:hypothetical protein